MSDPRIIRCLILALLFGLLLTMIFRVKEGFQPAGTKPRPFDGGGGADRKKPPRFTSGGLYPTAGMLGIGTDYAGTKVVYRTDTSGTTDAFDAGLAAAGLADYGISYAEEAVGISYAEEAVNKTAVKPAVKKPADKKPTFTPAKTIKPA